MDDSRHAAGAPDHGAPRPDPPGPSISAHDVQGIYGGEFHAPVHVGHRQARSPSRRPQLLAFIAIVAALAVVGTIMAVRAFQRDDAESGVPLTAVADAPTWDCGDAVVVPRVLPPEGLRVEGGRPADGVTASDTPIGFTVQGVPGRTVVLTGADVEVVATDPPQPGTVIPRICQGDPVNRALQVDLDAPVLTIAKADPARGDGRSASDTGWPYSVAGDDPEHFVLFAKTDAKDVAFVIRLRWSAEGRTGELRVDNQGAPFRVASTRDAAKVCATLRDTTYWLLPLGGAPCPQ